MMELEQSWQLCHIVTGALSHIYILAVTNIEEGIILHDIDDYYGLNASQGLSKHDLAVPDQKTHESIITVYGN